MGTNHNCCRVVVTGGPGGGKTTAADLFRRELGESVVVVPEAATLLYSGGFPRVQNPEARQAAQRAIFHVQRNLEDVQAMSYQSRVLICDRGTIDGAAYWPTQAGDFFQHMGTTLENELERYDAVVFFETAAVGQISIEGGNPVRIESNERAVEIDHALKQLWANHPQFHFIPHERSFFKKISTALNILSRIVSHQSQGHIVPSSS
ncbi:MAG: AAA family ATPase [Bdellovibrionales bacterium]